MEQDKAHLRGDLRGTGDVAGRFQRDLRALRAQAGLDQAELAARAHYPRDVITAAESGRALPELPVLAAYVRGCMGSGSDFSEWEDRWRAVTGATASPLPQTRVAGLSGAARAGARISESSSATQAEEQDPAVIMAVLDRFATRMAQPTAASRNSEPAGGPVPATAGEPVPGPAGIDATVQEPAGARRAGASGRALAVVVIAAALFCLLILMR